MGTIIQADKDLLNPHGSDETLFILSWFSMFAYFLTHTVQMKLFSKQLNIPYPFFFLTHTVQMKPKDKAIKVSSIPTS